jgi:hypothetical protein
VYFGVRVVRDCQGSFGFASGLRLAARTITPASQNRACRGPRRTPRKRLSTGPSTSLRISPAGSDARKTAQQDPSTSLGISPAGSRSAKRLAHTRKTAQLYKKGGSFRPSVRGIDFRAVRCGRIADGLVQSGPLRQLYKKQALIRKAVNALDFTRVRCLRIVYGLISIRKPCCPEVLLQRGGAEARRKMGLTRAQCLRARLRCTRRRLRIGFAHVC